MSRSSFGFGLALVIALSACQNDVAPPLQRHASGFSRVIGRAYTLAPSRMHMNSSNENRSGLMSATSYGLAPPERLDGAVAWVIRDAQASQPLLIVLSRQDLSDQWYAIARHLMYRDVQAFPTTTGRRVVKLYKDQQVQIEEAGVIKRSNTRFAAASVSTHIAPEMQRRGAHHELNNP